ncbi:MAG: hypothetical protein ACK452_12925 [Bacteroidota bacterium]|jgi:hypothetical protein
MAKGIITVKPITSKPGLINIVGEDDNSPTGETVKYIERNSADVDDLVEFDISDVDGMAINIKVVRLPS